MSRRQRRGGGRARPALALATAIACAATSTSCGGATSRDASAVSDRVVVSVGAAPISVAAYEHWMGIGAATVEMPKPTGPLPTAVEYRPPEFAACVAHLRAVMPPGAPTATLRSRCSSTYAGIRRRVLQFLITAYWLRGEAAQVHMSPSRAEIQRAFEQERQTYYPTAAAFRRLQQASHQTISDLQFATETRMLSTQLLARFTAAARARNRNEPEQAIVAAFNRHIESAWKPRTDCRPGYVVEQCSQYRG